MLYRIVCQEHTGSNVYIGTDYDTAYQKAKTHANFSHSDSRSPIIFQKYIDSELSSSPWSITPDGSALGSGFQGLDIPPPVAISTPQEDAVAAPSEPTGGSITTKRDLFAERTPVGGGTPLSPAAPAPTQAPAAPAPTQEQNDAAFYTALSDATAAAKAGDPTLLQNFDTYFNQPPRNPAEYTQSFYYGSSPNEQISMINNMPISQEMKTKVIAENQAIQAGARGPDSVDNIVAWFNAGGPTDPGTDAFLASDPQNRINVVNATNISQQSKVDVITEILSGNPGTVTELVTYHGVHGLGVQPSAANWASSATPENQIAVVNATNISQDSKNRVIAEIQAGSNTSDSVYDKISWIESGNPPSAGALAILNPPPPPVVATPEPVAVTEPAPAVDEPAPTPDPAPEAPGSVVEPETDSSTTPPPENPTTPTDDVVDAAPAETDDSSSPEQPENEEQQEDTAAQAQEEEEKQAALATATAAKHSAKESRMKKLMSMRKPWSSGGASSSTGSDAMVAPSITPSSQIPPPPL